MSLFGKIFGAPGSAEPFVPVNELETRLQAFVTGNAAFEAFLELLLRSQVFVLIKGDPEAVTKDTPIAPLVLIASTGFPALCIFTSPDRALRVQKKHNAFAGGMLVEFRWVLESAPEGLGLLVNPEWEATVEQPPYGFAAMRRDVLEKDG